MGTIKIWNLLAKQSVSTWQVSLADRQELRFLQIRGGFLGVGVTCFEG